MSVKWNPTNQRTGVVGTRSAPTTDPIGLPDLDATEKGPIQFFLAPGSRSAHMQSSDAGLTQSQG
jgi:hypothetical protein